MIAKNSSSEKNDRSGLSDEALLLLYCKDINDWHKAWEIDTLDLDIGIKIVEQFKPFLVKKIQQGRVKKTVRTHANYLWALGAELIAQLNVDVDEDERALSARELILNHIGPTGGPYWRHAWNDEDHDRYDSTCRQFFNFLSEKSD